MAGPIEYYSFERVLKELQIEDDELKRLVSEGEIRAFRDEDKMKFKKSDIEGLKKGRMTEPTIILPSGESDSSSEDSEVLLVEEDTSETLLDIDDVAESSSTTVPTVDFSSSEVEDASSSEPVAPVTSAKVATKSAPAKPAPAPAKGKGKAASSDELSFEDDSSYVLESSDDVLIDSSQELVPVEESGAKDGSGETFIDSDTGMQTEPLDLDSGEGSQAEVAPVRTSRGKTVSESSESMQESHGTRTQVVVPVAVEEPLSAGMMFCLVATTLLMLFGGVIAVNTLKEVDTPVTSWLTDLTAQLVPPKYAKEKSPEKHLQWRTKRRENPSRPE